MPFFIYSFSVIILLLLQLIVNSYYFILHYLSTFIMLAVLLLQFFPYSLFCFVLLCNMNVLLCSFWLPFRIISLWG